MNSIKSAYTIADENRARREAEAKLEAQKMQQINTAEADRAWRRQTECGE
jgi:hypothetical protein